MSGGHVDEGRLRELVAKWHAEVVHLLSLNQDAAISRAEGIEDCETELRAALLESASEPYAFTDEDKKELSQMIKETVRDALAAPLSASEAQPPEYSKPCGLCGGQIESRDDTEWHGLGNCVPVCERCTGSGIEPSVPPEEKEAQPPAPRDAQTLEDCEVEWQAALRARAAAPEGLREIERLEAVNRTLRDKLDGEYWVWQGDGEDHLESLSCPILITPQKFRAALAASVEALQSREGNRERTNSVRKVD